MSDPAVTATTNAPNQAVIYMVPWRAVAPIDGDPIGGRWSIWTRGLNPARRICWLGDLDGHEQLAEYIADLHNHDLGGGDA